MGARVGGVVAGALDEIGKRREIARVVEGYRGQLRRRALLGPKHSARLP
jgi:hypothetical protein